VLYQVIFMVYILNYYCTLDLVEARERHLADFTLERTKEKLLPTELVDAGIHMAG